MLVFGYNLREKENYHLRILGTNAWVVSDGKDC